jgi:hypothetical protein
MQHETLEGEQESLDNPTLRKKVMSAPIVKDAYAPITPDVALEHSVRLATKLAEPIRSLYHRNLQLNLDFFSGLWNYAVEPVLQDIENEWADGVRLLNEA